MPDPILILTSEHPPLLWGGVGRYVMEIAAELTAAGDPPMVCCVPSYVLEQTDAAPTAADARFIVDPAFAELFRAQVFDVAAHRELGARIAARIAATLDRPIRAIFLQDFYLAGVADALSTRFPGARRIYFAHLPLSARFSYFEKTTTEETQQALEAGSILWADRVLTPSAFARRTLAAVYPVAPERIDVAPLAARPRVGRRASRDASLVACVGRFTQQKGWDAVIDVVARLEAARVPARYAFVGTGNCRADVEAALRAIAPPDRLRFYARLEPLEAMPRLFEEATVFLQMSAYETFGLAALEAAAAGATPVLTEVGAVGEVFPAGSGAMLVPPGDVAAAAAAVAGLLTDPDAAADRGRRVRRHAARRTWADHRAQLSTILDDVAASQ